MAAGDNFERGETIVCSAVVQTTANVNTDPATSMKISVVDIASTVVTNSVVMDNDSTGNYHYDQTTNSSFKKGRYDVKYEAIDGARTTYHRDYFYITK